MNKSKSKKNKTTKKMIGRGKDKRHRRLTITGSKYLKKFKFPERTRKSMLKRVARYNEYEDEHILDPISYEPIDTEDVIVINGDKVYAKSTFTPYINQKLGLPLDFNMKDAKNSDRKMILTHLFSSENIIRDTYENPLDTISKIGIILEIYADLYSNEFIKSLEYLLKQRKILKDYYESDPSLFDKMAKMIADSYVDTLDTTISKDKQSMRMINTWNYYIAGAIFQLKHNTTHFIAEIEQTEIDNYMDYIKQTETMNNLNSETREEYIETCYAIHSAGNKIYTIYRNQTSDLQIILYPVLETLRYALDKQNDSIKQNENLIINQNDSIKQNETLIINQYDDVVDFGMNIGGTSTSLKNKHRKTHKLRR